MHFPYVKKIKKSWYSFSLFTKKNVDKIGNHLKFEKYFYDFQDCLPSVDDSKEFGCSLLPWRQWKLSWLICLKGL